MADDLYEASLIKRARGTREQVDARREALLQIVSSMRPMTVRQVFYQAAVRQIVPKTEAAYARVQHDLVLLRRAGQLPYEWLADNTRWQRKARSFNSVEDALRETARLYRKNLWADQGCYAEVWLEKDALAGVVLPTTTLYDVPLMIARGYASLSFLHAAAVYINSLHVPAFIYHLGDFDPSGVNAAEKIEQTLREMAPAAEIYFERLAVLPEQIEAWHLPTRPTKTTDSRVKSFGSDVSVELDAIAPDLLRAIVKVALEDHLPEQQFAVLKEAEQSEREVLEMFVGRALQ